MKLTRRKLRQLIMEMVYVNSEGEAVATDSGKPYDFMAGHEDETVSMLGSHPDIENRKMAAFLAGDEYEKMGQYEEDVHKMHKEIGSDRDQDTIFKNMRTDPRQVKMVTSHIDKYKSQIEQIAGDYIFSANRYHDYLEDFNRGAVRSRRAGLASLLYDTSEKIMDNIPQISRIIKFYDSKGEHRTIDAILLKIQNVIHDYLMHDRGLYGMFYDEKKA